MDEKPQSQFDTAGVLATLYTLGYLCMVGLLFFIEIPPANKEPLLTLFGLMSAIQMSLIAFYFGSSKTGEATQRALEQRQGKADAVMQEIAKAAPVPAVIPALSDAVPVPLKTDTVNVEAAGNVNVTEASKP